MVRDRKLYSLEEAVYKLSGFPAARFGLTDRGLIREQFAADLVVFDPVTVTDRATYERPHQLSAGIDFVLVGGRVVLAHGKPVAMGDQELPGRALRRG
jgi:N-acyl-D-aspartate/D-glutamate deacylase